MIPVLKRVSELACRGLFKEEVQLEFSSRDVGEDFDHFGSSQCFQGDVREQGCKDLLLFPLPEHAGVSCSLACFRSTRLD